VESGGRVIKTLNQNILYIFIVYNPPCTGSPARFFFTHTGTAHGATAATGTRTAPDAHICAECAFFFPVCAVIFTVMIDMYYSNLAFALKLNFGFSTYYP